MGRTLVLWASPAKRSAPQRAACIGISQQWRAYLTHGHSVTPAQVTSTRVKEESMQNAPPRGGLRFWHKADMLNALTNVRLWGQSGHP